MMESTRITDEWDESKTWGGLPAPQHWFIVDHIWDYHTRTERVGFMWERTVGQRLTVIEDLCLKADGHRWLHISVAKPNKKLPTYEDLQEARRLFIGDRECYMIFPTSDRYVNFENVLHLWCCVDAPEGVLPHMEEKVEIRGEEVLSI